MLGNIYQTIEALGPTGGDPDNEITLGAPPGLDGLDGIGIFSLSPIGANTYRFTFTDGNYSDFVVPQGQPGDRGQDGITPTFAAGTITVVTVGGTPAATVRASTIPNRYLIDFVLPVGPTGAVPWQTPPVPWAASTVYTSVAPASTVTNSGFTYVCATSHQSSATFDATKWARVSVEGPVGPLGPVGPPGPSPFQTPPTPWAPSTAYSSTAPASAVTYSGASYVCSTSHTSVGSFDATKFTLIAAAGTAGTPATTSDIRAGTDTTKYVPPKPLYDAHAFVALTDAATIAVDFATGINFRVTLAGNRTLGAPTNLKDGQSGIIRVKQDATGSRTLAFNTAYKFPGGTVPTLSTAANAVDRFAYVISNDGTSNIVECTALEKTIG